MAYITFDDELWAKIYIHNQYTNYSISTLGNVRNDNTGKLIKPTKVQDKYYVIPFTLIDENNNKYKKHKTLSRLVAEAFIPIPQKYIDAGYTAETLEVDHIRDGDPLNHEDNTIYNLQWLTKQENISKAQQHGLYAKDHIKGTKKPEWSRPGELNPTSLYTDDQIRRVCERLVQNKLDMHEIAKDTDTTVDLVHRVRTGRGWTHISKDYNFDHYDRVKGLQYEPFVLRDLDNLIMDGKDNKTIREILGLKDNKTTSALISKHRKKCGKNVGTRRKISEEVLLKLDELILNDMSNAEIRKELCMEHDTTTQSLIAAHRMKLKKPVIRNNKK